MRKWKIRTKMISGLMVLTFAIAILLYSSWSQMNRDRYLASEISQLADEIAHAHELNRLAETLRQAHTRFRKLSEDKKMIQSDQMIEFGRIEESSLAMEDASIHITMIALRSELTKYQELINERPQRGRSTHLLVDQGRQGASLDEIAENLQKAEVEWNKTNKLDPVVLSVENRHAILADRLNELVILTDAHIDSIQRGMKQFCETVHNEHRSKQASFWICTGLSISMLLLLARNFWTLIVVPFKTLFNGSQLIATGHHQHKIELGTDDEIGLMADTVNDITHRFNEAVAKVTQAKQHAEREVRDRTREVIQNEQLASVGFLAAGVAHEINNPLGAIAWGAEALEESLNDLPDEDKAAIRSDLLAELQKNLGLIQSEAFRCKGITKRLLHFSRLSDSSRDRENIAELVERVTSMVGKVGEYRCKKLLTHCEPEVIAYCNSQEIQQVVLNLISNALESVDTDGQVDVYVRQEIDAHSGNKLALVEVQDNGCGMNQEVMDHLFEPFFTRRRDNTGTGLGLSISYRIVSLHHGSLIPHSDGEGCGSKLTLRLPAERVQQEPSAALPSELNESPMDWNDVEKVA